jgi:hypothetical protein
MILWFASPLASLSPDAGTMTCLVSCRPLPLPLASSRALLLRRRHWCRPAAPGDGDVHAS